MSAEHVFDSIEQIPLVVGGVGAGLELFGRQRVRELLEEMPLILVQLLWRLYLHSGVQITFASAANLGQALVPDAERRARLSAFGHLHRFRPVQRRHDDLAAERQRREVDRDLAEEVHTVAAVELVLLNVDDDIEMAGGTAGRSCLAFTLEPELLSRRNA